MNKVVVVVVVVVKGSSTVYLKFRIHGVTQVIDILFSGGGNVVPVVMGGADYTKLAIPGSYINVMDFKTVKQLAEYLQYLDKNNTAYNEYFNWRLKYKVSPGYSFSLCRICERFNDLPETKVYDDFEGFWAKQGRCNEKYQLVKNMLYS